MKKKTISNILLVILLLVGLSLLLYPTFSEWWNSQHQSRAMAVYDEQVQEIDTSTIDNLFAQAREFNEQLNQASNKQQFIQDNYDLYEQQLNVGLSVMGYIKIPAISISLPIYHGTSQEVLQVGIGHVDWSSLPVGGEGTHTVLSGHTGLPSADLLTNLDAVRIGDRFSITVLNETMYYEVDQIEVVLPDETNSLLPVSGEDYATLVTCTPYGVNTHRLLVRGHRVTVIKNVIEEFIPDGIHISPIWVSVGTLSIIWIVLGITHLIKKRKETV